MKINLKTILCGVAAVFGFVAAMMLFAPALTDKILGVTDIKGSEVAFGKEELGLAASAYMLPLFLALIGVVCVVVAALGKGGKIVPIVAAVAFVGAAVCYFLPIQMIMFDIPEGEEADMSVLREEFGEYYKLAAGAIVGGIFSIIAAVVSVVPMFVCKENN